MTRKDKRDCPACSSSASILLGEKNGFDVHACQSCKSLFTDRVPDSSEAENYDEYYAEHNLTVPEFIVERVGEILHEFDPYRKTNRLLDIGSGAGTILDVAAKQGWEVYGLEVSEPAVRSTRARGLEVFHGVLKDAKYPTGHFDVVTASEILEHLPDPEGDLAEVARILRPGGLFWGTTPSAGAVSFRIMKLGWSTLSPPEHTQLYSKKGARAILAKAGFNDVKLKTYGVNPSEIANYFRSGGSEISGSERVNSGYSLNEQLTRSPWRKAIKRSLNETLNMFGLGDSLKIYARTSK